MKHWLLALVMGGALGAAAQSSGPQKPATDTAQQIKTVEASCGQCRFGLKGDGCSLAVRIDGKAYFVDGSNIDDHGDAHATDGFCNAIRKAEVKGKVANDRFVATYFKLLPATTPKK
ncbi:DUF6370 family protein [Pseudocnuella soli]|uniref:DUF6370 family protein n=1 Tax=Pseudocnuella soli TaxID=2502779 RepID=UPI001404DEA6|nr:DUF6370 family protein [Pseudocnuella soli]